MKRQQNTQYVQTPLMTTTEVAGHLQLRERKIYELVRQGAIPCTRAGGKLLFSRPLIDQWAARHLDTDE